MILLTRNHNNVRPFDTIFHYRSSNIPPPPNGHQMLSVLRAINLITIVFILSFCLITACLISYIQAKLRTWYAANARENANNHNNDMILGNWLSELTRFAPAFNFSPEAPPIHFHQHSQQISGDANDDFNEFLHELQHQSTRVNIGDDKCPSYHDICGAATNSTSTDNEDVPPADAPTSNEIRTPLLNEEESQRTTGARRTENDTEFIPRKKNTQKIVPKKRPSTLQPLVASSSESESES